MTGCLRDFNLCFDAPAGITFDDVSPAVPAGGAPEARQNAVTFYKPGTGVVAKVYVSNIGGIGGHCPEGTGHKAVITKVVPVKAIGRSPQDSGPTAMAVVQYLSQEDGGWTATTALTTSKAMMQVRETDVCDAAFASCVSLPDPLGLMRTQAGDQNVPVPVSRQQAEAQLAGPVHQAALAIFSTAHQR